jgi:hypothetical protein
MQPSNTPSCRLGEECALMAHAFGVPRSALSDTRSTRSRRTRRGYESSSHKVCTFMIAACAELSAHADSACMIVVVVGVLWSGGCKAVVAVVAVSRVSVVVQEPAAAGVVVVIMMIMMIMMANAW